MLSPERVDAPKCIDFPHLAEAIIVRPLEAVAPVGAALRGLLVRGAVRTFDSRILIEDPLSAVHRRVALPVPPVAPMLAPLAPIDATLERVADEGLHGNLMRLAGGFGALLGFLCATGPQRARIQEWAQDRGMPGAFFMTDRGGPSMRRDWLSTWEVHGDHGTLTMDKIWAINAVDFGFAWVAARGRGALAPVLVLVDPESALALQRQPTGRPYLGSSVQLGSVRGTLRLPASHAMRKGGAGTIKRFLSFARPRLVTSICLHLHWLARNARLRLQGDALDAALNLEQLARAVMAQTLAQGATEDAVMLLKFAANELLLELVTSEAAPRSDDQRDLLGLSKMEGSSYRCLLEVFSRVRSYVRTV